VYGELEITERIRVYGELEITERIRAYGELERTEKEAVLLVETEENYKMPYKGQSLLQPELEPRISRTHIRIVTALADLLVLVCMNLSKNMQYLGI
jgi:hypothetical protein